MAWGSRRLVRGCFLLCILLLAGAIGWSYASADQPSERTGGDAESLARAVSSLVGGVDTEPEVRRLNDVRNESGDSPTVTLVTTQGYYTPDGFPQLVAFLDNGTAVYRDTGYDAYFDVDPVSNATDTVEYVAATHYPDDCPTAEFSVCTRNVVVRANLSTGTERVVYAAVTPSIEATRWHDVDRKNETHLVVADIAADEVVVVDTRTDAVTWRWRAVSFYPDTGAEEPDWTHLNDVEVLPDGRITVSIRNMNEVLFLRPGAGVQDDWTLGDQRNQRILDEQHNPDYIPADRGGPALVVADSQNNRIVEYQRVGDSWERTWTFQDSRMQWPRDADRLPGGNTLVADTNTNRVVEVTPDGTVVWRVAVGMPYDVERLGTGDESAGGPSLGQRETVAGTDGRTVGNSDGEVFAPAWVWLKDATPSRVVNGLLFVAPPWVQFSDLVFGGLCLFALLCWCVVELSWSRHEPVAWLRRLPNRRS